MKQYVSWVVMALALAASGCKKGASSDTAAAAEPAGPKMVRFDPKALERLGIKTDTAGNTAADYEFQVTGTLDYNYDRYAEVGSIADGRITQLNFYVGEKVKKGDVLATLIVPDVAAAQASMMAAEAAAKIAKENQNREQALLEKELTTARESEVARGEAIRTEAELSAARARLSAMGGGLSSRLNGAGGLSLIAPIDGVIVRRDAVLGRFIRANETAYVVADPADLRAVINVYESDIAYFKIGADVEIRPDAHPGLELKGKVFLIEPSLGRLSRALRALISVPNPDGLLRPGEFVRASVQLPDPPNKNLLYVPSGAVQPLGEDDVVFVEKEPGVFEVRKVRVERYSAQVAAIGEGLSHGERIVIDGAFLLRGEVSKQ